LEWPLPLFDRGRAERARAEVRIDALEARLAVARLTLEAGREGALAAYERLRAAAAEAATAGDSVEPMLAAATASFRAGEVDLTDLLETLRAGSSTRLQALELRAAALEAHRELERLTGGR
jgi:outer membrane protein TolC